MESSTQRSSSVGFVFDFLFDSPFDLRTLCCMRELILWNRKAAMPKPAGSQSLARGMLPTAEEESAEQRVR